MKRKALALVLAVSLVLMGIPFGFAVKYKTATVVEVVGMVSILKAGGEKAFTPDLKTVLEHGDRIITGKGASISIQIDQDKYIKVGEKTYMSLSELMSEAESGGDATNIKLFTGKVFATLSKPLGGDDTFQIETPTAVMGAKGTKFFVKYIVSPTPEEKETGTTELVVLEGQVGLKTSVPLQFEGDPKLVDQEVEILVNANESTVLNPELIEGISNKIQEIVKAGTAIENVKIQEVVQEVSKNLEVEAKNLDLFVLEIIAETPKDYAPKFQENIKEIIEQKIKALPVEPVVPEAAEVLGIIYDIKAKLVDPKDPTKSITQVIPAVKPVVDVVVKEVVDKVISKLYITKVELLDVTGNDGISDHVEITFNKDVNDSTFQVSSGVELISDGSLGTLITTGLSYDSIPGKANVSQDNKIVLAINTSGKYPKTNPSGTLKIPTNQFIKDMDGSWLTSAINYEILDGVPPIATGYRVYLNEDYTSKYIKIEFTEPITEYDESLITKVKMTTSAAITFEQSIPLSNSLKLKHESDTLKMTNLDRETVYLLHQLASSPHEDFKLITSPNAPVYFKDAKGNQGKLPESLEFLGFTSDSAAAKIKSIEFVPVVAGQQYLANIEFSDHIMESSIQSLIQYPHALMSIFSYPYYGTVESVTYGIDSNTDKIIMSVKFKTSEGTFAQDDKVKVNYQALVDLFGRAVKDNDNSNFSEYTYDASTQNWVKNTSTELVLTSAKTVDNDKNGLVDHIKLTFNQPVDDSTFVSDLGIGFVTGGPYDLYDVNDFHIASIAGDVTDDEIVYLQLVDTYSSGENILTASTGIMGSLSIPNGLIRSLSGVQLGTVSYFTVSDGAAPVIIDVSANFTGAADEQFVRMTISENALTWPTGIWTDLRITNDPQATYAQATPLLFETVYNYQNKTEIKDLKQTTIETIKTMYQQSPQTMRFVLSPSFTGQFVDAVGNGIPLERAIFIKGVTSDNTTSRVETFEVSSIDDSSDYRVTVGFDDYLNQSVTSLIGSSQPPVVSFGLENATAQASEFVYTATHPNAITLSFKIDVLTGSISDGDSMTFALSAATDLYGRPVEDYYNSQVQSYRTYYYNAGPGTWSMTRIQPTGLNLLNAYTIDSNEDGVVDHLKLVYNSAVNDSSWNYYLQNVLESSGKLGTLGYSPVHTGNFGNIIDSENDETIYISLNVPQEAVYNTGEVGVLTLPSGVITSTSDVASTAVSGFSVSDGAAPIPVKGSIDLCSTLTNKNVTFYFSENLESGQSIDLTKMELFLSGSSFALNGGTVTIDQDKIRISNLPTGAIEDQTQSYISSLSEFLRPGGVSMRLLNGFSVTSASSNVYGPLSVTKDVYDVSPVFTTHGTTQVVEVYNSEPNSVKLVFDDYIETFNKNSNSASNTLYNISVMQGELSGAYFYYYRTDHKSFYLNIMGTPTVGDVIMISGVRHITNTIYDEINETPVVVPSFVIIYNGTQWVLGAE